MTAIAMNQMQRAWSPSPLEDDVPNESPSQWRRYGEARRKYLITQDEYEGGTSFHLHRRCRIQRYFQLADRVTQQFRMMYATWETNLEDTFIMGHRLLAFLEVALPEHPEYKSKSVERLRIKSLRELSWIRSKMEELALRIDEEVLNDFVSNDFVPEPDEESSVSSDEPSLVVFDPFDISDDMELSKTQDPTLDTIESPDSSVTSSNSVGPFDEYPVVSLEQPSDEHRVVVEFCDEAEEARFLLDEGGTSPFLRQIAEESVSYESDSEAIDSWAQDGTSTISSGFEPTLDPVRLALRELRLNREMYEALSPVPPPPPPVECNVTDSGKDDTATPAWGTFDFATVRQM